METKCTGRNIYWYKIEGWESQESFLGDSLEELQENLRGKPTQIEIICEKLGDENVASIIPKLMDSAVDLDNKIEDLTLHFRKQSAPDKLPGLILCCPANSLIAQQVRSRNPLAQWGGKLGRLALVWQTGNKHLIWHEALHLLGAEDCYDGESTEGNCEKEPRCIMQYAPTEKSVAPWPECLCLGTVSRLRLVNGRGSNDGDEPESTEYIIKKPCTQREAHRILDDITPPDSVLYEYAKYRVTFPPQSKDDVQRTTIGWHTKPVPRNTDFQSAFWGSKSSLYLTNDKLELPRKTHMSGKSSDGKYRFSRHIFVADDGSYITETSLYKN